MRSFYARDAMPRVCVVAAQVLGVRWACVMMFSSRNCHFAASAHGTTGFIRFVTSLAPARRYSGIWGRTSENHRRRDHHRSAKMKFVQLRLGACVVLLPQLDSECLGIPHRSCLCTDLRYVFWAIRICSLPLAQSCQRREKRARGAACRLCTLLENIQ